MKVLQIVDSPSWAISRLSAVIVKHNPQHTFRVLYVHPREVEKNLDKVREALEWNPQVVDLQYWNTARQLLEIMPELREKKLILNHHNQKDLLGYDWKDIDIHVAHTRYSAEVLIAEGNYDDVESVQYGIDLSYFTYDEKFVRAGKVVGYCGRIVPWKGLKDIVRACYELGYTLAIMGKFDKPDYWAEIPEEHRAIIDFGFMDANDKERLDYYRSISIFVGNSCDRREEGTLPLLEAMACGVPVVTTPSGVAADIIDDNYNAVVTPFENYEELKKNVEKLMEDHELQQRLRKQAWNTVKIMSDERYAWEMNKLYHKAGSAASLVSVIIPTYNSADHIWEILTQLLKDEYPHIEIVICDDGSTDGTKKTIEEFKKGHESMTIKYVNTGNYPDVDGDKKYGLAQARNMGVLESQGEFLVFIDSRLKPEKSAITEFITKLQSTREDAKIWVFGNKGADKESFVENFSAVRRSFFIRSGMCCERIDKYGGMSQELRGRFQWIGFSLMHVPQANATPLKTSHLTAERKQDIIQSKIKLWKMGLK